MRNALTPAHQPTDAGRAHQSTDAALAHQSTDAALALAAAPARRSPENANTRRSSDAASATRTRGTASAARTRGAARALWRAQPLRALGSAALSVLLVAALVPLSAAFGEEQPEAAAESAQAAAPAAEAESAEAAAEPAPEPEAAAPESADETAEAPAQTAPALQPEESPAPESIESTPSTQPAPYHEIATAAVEEEVVALEDDIAIENDIAAQADAAVLAGPTTTTGITWTLYGDGRLTFELAVSGTVKPLMGSTIINKGIQAAYDAGLRHVDIVIGEGIKQMTAASYTPASLMTMTLDIPSTMTSLASFKSTACTTLQLTGVSGPGASMFYQDGILYNAAKKQAYMSTLMSGDISFADTCTTVYSGMFFGTEYGHLSIPASLTSVQTVFVNWRDSSVLSFSEITVAPGNTALETCTDDLVRYNDLQAKGGTTTLLRSRMNAPGTYVDGLGVVYSSNRAQLIKAPTSLNGVYEIDPACTAILDSAFLDCSFVSKVSGTAVRSVGASAFSGCLALTGIDFPALASMGDNAFKSTAIVSYAAPATLAELGATVFSGSSLASIDLSATQLASIGVLGASALERFSFPANVKTLSALQGCTKLATIDLSAYPQLSTVSFQGCTALTSAELPASVTSVSFQGCTALTSVELPVSVTSVSFQGCTALKAVDLSAVKMTELPKGIFNGCSSLESVVFPATMTSFAASLYSSDGAFVGCTSLRSIDLSALRMASIPAYSFQGCTALTDVQWPQDLVSLGQSSFQGTGFQAVELPTGFTALGGSAFADCGNLTKVTLPPTVATVGANAFQNCKSLTAIDIPESVTSIGSLAFAGTGITSFKFGANLYAGTAQSSWSQDGDSYGGAQLFCATTPVALGRLMNGVTTDQTDWSQVNELDLSECSLDYLPPYMFAGLNKLTEVTLPHSIASVDVGAFFGCTALKDVYVYNQNIRLAGAGTATDSGLGWVSVSYPAFSHWEYQGTNPDPSQDHAGWKFVTTADMNLHGLAYASNDLIAYAENNDCTFVPFVVLDGYDTKSAFGYDVYGYNEVQGVPESLEFTGEDLMGQIAPKIHFTDPGVPESYDVDVASSSRMTYTVTDAAGNVVTEMVRPGTYQVRIAGASGARDVFGSKTITVTVAHKPADVQVTGTVSGKSVSLTMDDLSGDALAALGAPGTAAAMKAALDAATHRVDVSTVSSGAAYDDVVASVGPGTLGMVFNVDYYLNGVQVHNGFGSLQVTVAVPAEADEHWVVLHHRHQDGSITTQNLKCTGSTLSFTVTDLSTFAVEIGRALNPVEQPAELTPTPAPTQAAGASTGGTRTIYQTIYRTAPSSGGIMPAPLAQTGLVDEVLPEADMLAKGASPDIAYGGNAAQSDDAAEAAIDWLPIAIAAVLALLAVSAVAWLAAGRRKAREDARGRTA